MKPRSIIAARRVGTYNPHGTGRRQRRRGPGSEDGLVLISVLLVILMGTAIAMITARDTRYALRSAGHDRADVQGRYAAEGALMTTLTWFDMMGPEDFNRFVIAPWKDPRPPAAPVRAPWTLPRYPEPNMPLWQDMGGATAAQADAWDHDPARVVSSQMFPFPNALDVPPQTATDTNANLFGVDVSGTYGPGAYQPAPVFETDLYDCTQGESVDLAGGGTAAPLVCMMTARNRKKLLAVDGGSVVAPWPIFSKFPPVEQQRYDQPRFAHLHDASAAIETLPVPNQ